MTDFGLKDGYVAQMKGVILGIAPDCHLVDVSHEVPPQAVDQAARLLAATLAYFPRGTIHVVVVDPGVGSQRRILAGELDGQRVVLPDNGLLSPVLLAAERIRCFEVVNADLFLQPVSRTFHGRDIMAPVAAHLERGLPLDHVGPACDIDSLVRLPEDAPRFQDGCACTRVVAVDRFGNAQLNLLAGQWDPTTATSVSLRLTSTGRRHEVRRVETYAEAEPGQVVMLIGSQGVWEIAVVNGSAADHLSLQAGCEVELSPPGRR